MSAAWEFLYLYTSQNQWDAKTAKDLDTPKKDAVEKPDANNAVVNHTEMNVTKSHSAQTAKKAATQLYQQNAQNTKKSKIYSSSKQNTEAPMQWPETYVIQKNIPMLTLSEAKQIKGDNHLLREAKLMQIQPNPHQDINQNKVPLKLKTYL